MKSRVRQGLANKGSASALKLLLRAFVPIGYPRTVHPSYARFVAWSMMNTMSGTVMNVISTQSLFSALIPSATVQASAATSAAFNWIMKDGLGQLGGMAVAGFLGPYLDIYARPLRFWATGVMTSLAALLEFSTPFLCDGGSNWVFIALASTANVAKNVAWTAGSATRAHLMQCQAISGNLGELTGKSASQMTLASLLGSGVGLWLLTTVPPATTGAALGAFMLIHLTAAYKASQVAVSNHLTLNKLTYMIKRGELMSPELLSQAERVVGLDKVDARIHLNSRLMQDRLCPDALKEAGFSLYRDKFDVYLWTVYGLCKETQIAALLEALEVANVADTMERLQHLGWSVDRFVPPVELTDESQCFFIKASN